jgi:hypothetical protein
VAVAGTLLIVLANLRGSNHEGLGFNGSGSKQDGPVRLAGWYRKGTRVRDYIRGRI